MNLNPIKTFRLDRIAYDNDPRDLKSTLDKIANLAPAERLFFDERIALLD